MEAIPEGWHSSGLVVFHMIRYMRISNARIYATHPTFVRFFSRLFFGNCYNVACALCVTSMSGVA